MCGSVQSMRVEEISVVCSSAPSIVHYGYPLTRGSMCPQRHVWPVSNPNPQMLAISFGRSFTQGLSKSIGSMLTAIVVSCPCHVLARSLPCPPLEGTVGPGDMAMPWLARDKTLHGHCNRMAMRCPMSFAWLSVCCNILVVSLQSL